MSKTANSLKEFLQNPSNFSTVNLGSKNITNDDCAKLAAALKDNNTVTELQLSHNRIGDAGVVAIAEGLKVNKTVTQLQLAGNQIGDVGAAAIGEAIKGNNTITWLLLSWNQIGDAGAAAIGEGLMVNKTVNRIDLNRNQIGDSGAAAIGEGLKVNKTVNFIVLDQNQIGDAGAAVIGEGLKVNATVANVYLNQNQIGDTGAAAIGGGLKINKTVTQLHLNQNQIGDTGAAAIGGGLKINKTVTYIDLHQNKIGDAGAVALAEGLKVNKTITYLHLHSNQITVQGLNLLKVSWQGNASYLYVTSQTIAAVQSANPANQAQKQVDKLDQDCFFTAFNNDLALVQKSLSNKGIDLHQPDSNGKTLLWHAAFFGREQLVKLLLEGGVQLNCFNRADKAGHPVLEVPTLLKNTGIINMIKVAMLADHVYMMEGFDLQDLDLSLGDVQSKSNRQQFLDRLKGNLLKNGIPEHYLAEHYKVNLQEYLKNALPDNFSNDIVILLENLYLGRDKVMNSVQKVLRELLQQGDEVELVKLLATKEEAVALMVNSKMLDQAVHTLESIILTKEEKQVVDALLQRYDSLDQVIKILIKQNQAKQEAKAIKFEAEKLKQKTKLKEAEEAKAAKAAKDAAKVKALEEEKVKEYVPELDLNITKIFAEGALMAGDLVDHNQTIRQVSELIKNSSDRLQGYNHKGMLLLGDTGAGKSTLAHLLIGSKLKAIVDDKSGELIVDTMQPFADIVIGHRMASQTKIPNKCLADGTVIWDCPGFNDTDPVQEIANSFYIKKLFETTYEMKFVLVVPEHYLVRDKGNHFLATLSSFMKTFSNIEAIDGSMSLVITQVTTHKQPQHIKNSIEQILADNESVTERQKILVNKLINSSLHLFHKPKDEGEFNVVNPLETMEGLSQYIKGSPDMANMSISVKALECALPLFSTAGSNFNKILEITTKAILEATDCLKANPNNLFAQNYHIIKDMVPIAISHKSLALHQEIEHFPELDLLFGLQKILGSNQTGSMLEGLNVLQQALEAIAEYSGSGNIALKNQVQDYAYCLKQQYEYVKFFASICGKELPAAHLTELLQLCRAKVVENLEFQVSSLHIDQSTLDADYYHKAIGYLEQYPNSKPCVKLKALCYSGLAGIAEHKGDSDSAIGCYVKAIETSKHQPEIYEKLGKLFFSKGQYAKAIEAYKVVNNEFEIKACFKEWLKQSPKNPDIMLKQAEYFESIGRFEAARKYYGFTSDLIQNAEYKAQIWQKISNILTTQSQQLNAKAQEFGQKAQDHDFFNFDSVTPEFIHNLLGDAAIFNNFHA